MNARGGVPCIEDSGPGIKTLWQISVFQNHSSWEKEETTPTYLRSCQVGVNFHKN